MPHPIFPCSPCNPLPHSRRLKKGKDFSVVPAYASSLAETSVLALSFGLCGGALPFRTGDLSLMHAAGLGKRSLSFFLSVNWRRESIALSSGARIAA
eukprot:1156347-Pelagomonas_calceolata.AAC.2